jgi:glutamine synthetase
MINDANPADCNCQPQGESKQTFEFRVPDGSADIYLLVAGLVVAALHGINMPNSLEMAEQLYVDVNIFKPEFKEKLSKLKQLPASCFESAEALNQKRQVFEKGGIFPKGMIDSRINKLKAFNDKGLSEKLFGNNEEIAKLVHQYMHIG